MIGDWALSGQIYLRNRLLRYTPVRHSRKEKTVSPMVILLQRCTIKVLQFAQGLPLQSATWLFFLLLPCWMSLLRVSPFWSIFSMTKWMLSRIPIMKPPRHSHTYFVPKGAFCMTRSAFDEVGGENAQAYLVINNHWSYVANGLKPMIFFQKKPAHLRGCLCWRKPHSGKRHLEGAQRGSFSTPRRRYHSSRKQMQLCCQLGNGASRLDWMIKSVVFYQNSYCDVPWHYAAISHKNDSFYLLLSDRLRRIAAG